MSWVGARAIVPEESSNVVTAAFRDLACVVSERSCGFVEEVLRRFHDQAVRVAGPFSGDAARRLSACLLESTRGVAGCRDCRRAAMFGVRRWMTVSSRASSIARAGAHRREEVAVAHPIGRAIYRAAIAEDDGGVLSFGDRLTPR